MALASDLWKWKQVGWAEVKIEIQVDANGRPTAIRTQHRRTPGSGTWKPGAELLPGKLPINFTHVGLQPGFYATLDDLQITATPVRHDRVPRAQPR